MPFAQLVIGPPGSGKSTYCDGMQQFMSATGRQAAIVNLDPANDHASYTSALDIRDLVSLEEVMEQEELGPNGGVLYTLEELEHNFAWLESGLAPLKDSYILFDCPGQAELFTHHSSLRDIFFKLQKLNYRLVVIHLVDSICLTRPSLYMSTLLLALRSMLQLDLPHLNVLAKIDKLASYDPPPPLPLAFFTEVQSLEYLMPFLEAEQRGEAIGPEELDPVPSSRDIDLAMEDGDESEEQDENEGSKFSALNKAIAGLVEDFSLVGFETLAVEDKRSMAQLLHTIDRASGYAFGPGEGANESVWQTAVREGGNAGFMDIRDVEERWIHRKDELDEVERRGWPGEADAIRAGERSENQEMEMMTGHATRRKDTEDDDDSMGEELKAWRESRKEDTGIKIGGNGHGRPP